MKKFDLSKLNLSANEVLQRSEMKKITGGYSGGTCGYAYKSGGKWYGQCGVSQATALHMTAGYGSTDAYWCCQSCGSTFYC